MENLGSDTNLMQNEKEISVCSGEMGKKLEFLGINQEFGPHIHANHMPTHESLKIKIQEEQFICSQFQ